MFASPPTAECPHGRAVHDGCEKFGPWREDYGGYYATSPVAEEYSHDYIQSFYGVPAEKGGRVAYTWQGRREGMIVGFVDAHLLVLLDGEEEPRRYHPTWEIEYLIPAST